MFNETKVGFVPLVKMESTIQAPKSPVKLEGRLQYIDFARGLVMVIMAWDHASGFWMQLHGGLEGIYPARNPALGIALFLASFVSHWCAPTFVFLSGVSLALSVKNRLNRGDT